MKTDTMMVVTKEGVERWDIAKTMLNVGPGINVRFAEGVIRKLANVATLASPFGSVGMATHGEGEVWWTVEVLALTMNAPFALVNSVLVPVFDAGTTNVKMEWEVPPEMTLLLSVNTIQDGSEVRVADQYLHAFDLNGMSYRLPVSNIYEDCRLCSGKFDSRARSHFESLDKALKQFVNSPWNADLYRGSDEDHLKTQCMFRFHPTNGGFEQLEMTCGAGRNWTHLCTKAVNEVTNNYIAR